MNKLPKMSDVYIDGYYIGKVKAYMIVRLPEQYPTVKLLGYKQANLNKHQQTALSVLEKASNIGFQSVKNAMNSLLNNDLLSVSETYEVMEIFAREQKQKNVRENGEESIAR